jgi:oligopeptide/dipeptide ABC transporter ATP-binding protein
MPLLTVQNLSTAFQTDEGLLTAVDGVSFTIQPGQTLGLVGESGCGKSVTAFSINRLLPQPSGRILSGSILFNGEELTTLPDDQLRAIRGRDIGMIFQEPMAALNPVHRIGHQLSEVFLLHTRCSKKSAWDQSIALLRKVGIPEPEQRATEFPHQLSGGMKQRVVIAMAIALKPKLIIADEPTTALDVTVQAQILTLLKDLQKEMGMGLLLITHDLGVIAETCDDVIVMYAGRIVEQAPVRDLFTTPRHAYTRGLIASIPRLTTARRSRLHTIPGTVPSRLHLPTGCRVGPRDGRRRVARHVRALAAHLPDGLPRHAAAHDVAPRVDRLCKGGEVDRRGDAHVDARERLFHEPLLLSFVERVPEHLLGGEQRQVGDLRLDAIQRLLGLGGDGLLGGGDALLALSGEIRLGLNLLSGQSFGPIFQATDKFTQV